MMSELSKSIQLYFNVFLVVLFLSQNFSIQYSWLSFKTVSIFGVLALYSILVYELVSLKYALNKKAGRLEAGILQVYMLVNDGFKSHKKSTKVTND